MIKVAIVVLADTETHEDMARVHNALLAVKEFREAKDNVKLIFDGAGTRWINELSKPGAFGVKESALAYDISLSEEYEGHPSFRELLAQGYQVITF